jgi:adenylate kinase
MINLVFLGAPGSGKGTYAAKISEMFKIPAISTGEILRQAMRGGSALGSEVKSYVEGGKLVPDSVMGRVLEERIGQADCANGFILDGYPRTLAQAETLERVLKARGTAVTIAVGVEATEDLLLQRLGGRRSCPKCGAGFNVHTLKPAKDGICDKCGSALVVRPDDEPVTIRKRLEVYREQSAPLVAWYKTRGVLRPVSSDAAIPEVVSRIVTVIKEMQGS